jgi:hypothetical protein
MATKETRDIAGFDPMWTDGSTKIHWLVDGNPKRPHGKSYGRFEAYFGSETVQEYLDKGGTKADLRYDWTKLFLDLESDESDDSETPDESAPVEMADAETVKEENIAADDHDDHDELNDRGELDDEILG